MRSSGVAASAAERTGSGRCGPIAALLIEIGLINVWHSVNAGVRQVAGAHKA